MTYQIIELVLAVGAVLAGLAIGGMCLVGLTVWVAGLREPLPKPKW